MNIEVTIDFSELSISEKLDLIQSLSKDRKKLVSEDGSLNQELLKVIDLDSLSIDEIQELAERAYDELSLFDKADFIANHLSDANDSYIEDYYKDNICQGDDDNEEDYYEEDSFDPDTADDPSRCRMVAHTLRAYNHSRLLPTLEEAMRTVKQMYNYMGWK